MNDRQKLRTSLLILCCSISHFLFASTTMVKDIAQLGPNGSSSPQNFATAGSVAYFAADDGIHGRELWKTDGTGNSTVLVKDVVPGRYGSNPRNITAANRLVFFIADDIEGNPTLWRSNGTAAGTSVVRYDLTVCTDGYPYSGTPSMLAVNGILYFAASIGSHGCELWRSNGTEGGTRQIKDIQPGFFGSSPDEFTAFGGSIYFSATRGDTRRLFRTDGTAAGTVEVAGGAEFPELLTPMNGILYFSANGGLWKTDGSASLLVKDVGISEMKPANGILFISNWQDWDLWISDGTPSGTVRLKTFPWLPEDLTPVGDKLFFSVGSVQLWKTDGTPEGTVKMRTIYDGIDEIAVMGNEVFISGIQELWKSNGTIAGTQKIKTFACCSEFGRSVHSLTALNGVLFFAGNDKELGDELWKTNGTIAGTTLLKDIRGIVPGSSNPSQFTNCAGLVYFFAGENEPSELWKTNGTTAGTIQVKKLAPTVTVLDHLTCAGVHVFFHAFNRDKNTGQLWLSNGTSAGTVPLLDLPAGTFLTPLNGQILFGYSRDDTGNELWKTDGTRSGTRLVKDIAPGSTSSFPSLPARVMNGELYFTANDGTHGIELWKTDGTTAGTRMLRDISPGVEDSRPQHFAVMGNNLFFVAEVEKSGNQLWKCDGTTEGTVVVKSFPEATYPTYLAAAGTNLFFHTRAYSYRSISARQLWKSDGTTEGTIPIKDLFLSRVPNAVGNSIFFPSYNSGAGVELWTSDGTSAGTKMVKDICSGAQGSNIYSIRNLNGIAIFTADDCRSGSELWLSDGTTHGTFLLKDINFGIAASTPNYLVRYRDIILFAADDGIHGNELWKTDGR